MTIKLYNTLTRKKEDFVPIDPDLVKIYSCGPTVYGEPHVGNFRAFMLADILRSVITHVWWYDVKHVMNITDVWHLTDDGDQGEDKMEKWSRLTWKTVRELARYYENNFVSYMHKLNIADFDELPRATEHMLQQIQMVQTLTDKWYTYSIDGDGIYMDTSKIDDYGKMADLDVEGMNAAHRWDGEQIDISSKKSATDFALWKYSPCESKRQMEWIYTGERAWFLILDTLDDLPEDTSLDHFIQQHMYVLRDDLTEEELESRGFPGWHIECSAMAVEHLGEHIDIHTGGVDHVSVHHTNEIAQSECCYGCEKWVNYRLHQQFLNVDGGKMSKSKWDDLSVPGIMDKGIDPLDLRYFYFTWHYRSFLDFTREALKSAATSRKNLISKLVTHLKLTDLESWDTYVGMDLYMSLWAVISDDLDTVKTLSLMHTASKKPSCEDVVDILLFDQHVTKLWLLEWVREQLLLQSFEVEIPQDIQKLADERAQAKANKNYELSDELRNRLYMLWRVIKDIAWGYELKPK